MKPLVTKETRNVPTTVEIYAEVKLLDIIQAALHLWVVSEGNICIDLMNGMKKTVSDLCAYSKDVPQLLTPSEAIERLAELWGVKIPHEELAASKKYEQERDAVYAKINDRLLLAKTIAFNGNLTPHERLESIQNVLMGNAAKPEPASPVAPPIRTYKLVNAEWLKEEQRKNSFYALDPGFEYSIKDDRLYFNYGDGLSCVPSTGDAKLFLSYVARGIYVEMTPGRVVYKRTVYGADEFLTTDDAGDSRWLDMQYIRSGDGRSPAISKEVVMANHDFTKIIGEGGGK